MKNQIHTIRAIAASFLNDESGQSLIEYALVAGIIGLGAVIALTPLRTGLQTAFNSITSQLASAM